MTWRDALDRALDGRPSGTLRVTRAGAVAELDVREADRLGVRLGGVRLTHADARDVAAEADRLARDVRALPERLAAVEVDPGLGGAVLRSRPDELRGPEFFEVEVRGPAQIEVRRHGVTPEGDRVPRDWDLTRDQLDRLLGELDG